MAEQTIEPIEETKPAEIPVQPEVPVRVRMALVPSGSLNLVEARVALFNQLFAMNRKGSLILQISDLETEKVAPNGIQNLIEDLKWLQISWQEGPHRKSERSSFYQKYIQQLLSEQKAYPCYCSPEKLDEERLRFFSQGKPPRYSGACRHLSQEMKAQYESQGVQPMIRLKIDRQIIKFHDAIHGDYSFDTESMGDWVLQRVNGRPTLDFSTVIDDALLKISHVIRGENHLESTSRQISLYLALGWNSPSYAHIPVILGPDHTLLSKKHGFCTVEELKNEYLAVAVTNYLALMGYTSPDRREVMTLEEISERFTLERISRTSPVFDLEKLKWFNAHYLREIPDAEFLEMSKTRVSGFEEAFAKNGQAWLESTLLLLRKQGRTFGEIAEYLKFLIRPLGTFDEEAQKVFQLKDAPKVLKMMLEELSPQETINLETSLQVLENLKGKIKSKSKNVFAPLRVALTGQTHGPELPVIVSLLGKEEALKRIDYALTRLQHPQSK
jgi:nondiscriminating glutamyl-tRNA synthetase